MLLLRIQVAPDVAPVLLQQRRVLVFRVTLEEEHEAAALGARMRRPRCAADQLSSV